MFYRFASGLLAPLALAGCLADTVYYAEGVSVGTRDNQIAICDSDAHADFPVQEVIRYREPEYVPETTTCTPDGTCTVTEAYFEPPVPYTVDINETARTRAFQGCMGAAGFDRIDLPFCARGTPVLQSTVMPQLTGGSCLLRRGPGDPLVVNPA